MGGHKARQRPFDLVRLPCRTDRAERDQRLVQQRRLLQFDRDEHLQHRGALEGVELAGRTEVDEPEPAVVQQHHVARVRVGVEALAVEHRADL